MRRHRATLGALTEYSTCPMKFAYSNVYNITVSPPTLSLLFEQTLCRTVKTMVREKLRLGQLTYERAMLLWQIYTKNTAIETKPKLNSSGRDSVAYFCDWLQINNIAGIAIPRAIPIKLKSQEVLEVIATADIVLDNLNLIKIGQTSDIEQAVLAEDSSPWKLFNPKKKTWNEPTKRSYTPAVLKQLSRAMFRNIIWANRDTRCNKCVYSSICSNDDINSTKRKVQKRVEDIK